MYKDTFQMHPSTITLNTIIYKLTNVFFRFSLKIQSRYLVNSDNENVTKPISILTLLSKNKEMAKFGLV